MDLNIILWIGGTLFTLGIFAVKVGFGLGYGRIGIKGVSMALAGYVVLFITIALLSEKLMGMLAPLLSKGPYLHVLMAAGLIAWGIYAIKGSRGLPQTCQKTAEAALRPALLLIIPCPICLTAMTFSIWTALGVIKLPAALVGAGMGFSFAILAIVFLAIARRGKSGSPEVSLGLAMIAVGLYFFASLLLPAKIEAAKGMYGSFVDKSGMTDYTNTIGVLLFLLIAMFIGYFRKKKEYKK